MSLAFATPEAGSEYLATAEHYQYLARAIVDALRRVCLVLVTGEPPASPAMLGEALRKVTAPRRVIEVSCSLELDRESLFGDGWLDPDPSTPDGATAEQPKPAGSASAILVFADADRLTDARLRDLFAATRAVPPDPDVLEAGVLLARPAFRERFESPEIRPLEAGRTAELCVQQLERDEVEAFIRNQLPPGEAADLFTSRRIALIALTSGGDPAVINRLARRMLEIEPEGGAGGLSAKLTRVWRRRKRAPIDENSIAKPAEAIVDDEIAPPSGRPRRSLAMLRRAAIIILGCAALGLIVAEFRAQDVAALVSLARNHIMPRKEATDAPGRAAIAALPEAPSSPSSVTAAGSSSATPAPEPEPKPTARAGAEDQGATPAPQAKPEQIARGAEQPSGGPSPPPAPEPAARPGPVKPQLSAAEVAALVARGDAFLEAGDVVSARLFFERAAAAGDISAAMRLAVTYDAAFLDRAGLHGVRGDPEQASFWYQRARDLGEAKADQDVHGVETGPSGAPPPR